MNEPTKFHYTVDEIDRIRDCVNRAINGYDVYREGCWISASYQESDRIREIEEKTRTYLIAGIRPEDFEAQINERYLASRDRFFEWKARPFLEELARGP